jgi:hypothetical protein
MEGRMMRILIIIAVFVLSFFLVMINYERKESMSNEEVDETRTTPSLVSMTNQDSTAESYEAEYEQLNLIRGFFNPEENGVDVTLIEEPVISDIKNEMTNDEKIEEIIKIYFKILGL